MIKVFSSPEVDGFILKALYNHETPMARPYDSPPFARSDPVGTVHGLQAVLVCPRYYIAEVLRGKRKFGIYKWDIAGHEF
jgi:hypothetical protein